MIRKHVLAFGFFLASFAATDAIACVQVCDPKCHDDCYKQYRVEVAPSGNVKLLLSPDDKVLPGANTNAPAQPPAANPYRGQGQ